MRKVALSCFAVVLATMTWGAESSAGRWFRRARRCQPPPCCCQPQPCYGPVVYSPSAPGASAGGAPSQAFAAIPTPAKTFVFKGKTYQAVQSNERDESDEQETRALPPVTSARRPSDGEHFAGTDREGAKTSFANGPEDSFTSPGALLDSILMGASPKSNDMAMRPTLNVRSPRATEEQRNATVTAFLYATKKESDNDFHLLIGDNPNGGDGRFMTVEVSGLPKTDNRLTPQFQKVRDQYKDFFTQAGLDLPGDRYLRFPQPVPVTVTGSVFFDVDHPIGAVHSGNVKPETVWELHPVSNIVFGANGGQ